ncbi:TadE/TadG family type IV pilus assembly protein [Stratiformator vulcanicus]|uniref:TadE-like protein n=1 Tax=Stratiformator vulcanicus TaxID=2527980 RepID=A0A517R149_9PLAN|nr:TadE family protein [Stratiformator vulcanicus]QDT37619.1 TadE-like protein [Stratiformator vulcanicus]
MLSTKHRAKPERGNSRRGATTVEMAVVLGPLLLIIFGSIEFERALMVSHALEEAARAGCRIAILKGSTTESVAAEMSPILDSCGIDKFTINIEPKNVSSAQRWEPVSVTIEAQYKEVSWIPVPTFLSNARLTGSCTMPKEYSDNE